MNKFYTLVTAMSVGVMSFAQVAFESNLSSWTAGDPDGWMGTRTNILSENVVENMIGVEYGTSSAQLLNPTGDHKRFTTENVTVLSGETYEIKMWLTGTEGSELRTGFYDATNDDFYYNDYLNVFAETGGDITLVSQTINIPATSTSGEFIFSLKNTDAVVGIVLDSVSIAVTEPDVPSEVSIYDIQYAETPPFISPFEGELVTTSGVVTGVFQFGADEGRFFIQDGSGPWNGIYVYENGTELTLGDSVRVTGTVDEFFELTEIVAVTSIEVLETGVALPEAVVVSTLEAGEEQYEGVVVKVEDAECTNPDAGFGQFEVNDGNMTTFGGRSNFLISSCCRFFL